MRFDKITRKVNKNLENFKDLDFPVPNLFSLASF